MYKSTREASTRQEKAINKAIGGRRTPNSGAGKFQKGDLTTDLFLVEAKTCMQPKNSFSIKKEWLTKLKEEQYSMNKQYSTLCFDFGDEKDRFYIIDENTFIILKDLLQ